MTGTCDPFKMSKVVYRLVVGTTRIFTSEKQNVDCMTEKQTSCHSISRFPAGSFAAYTGDHLWLGDHLQCT